MASMADRDLRHGSSGGPSTDWRQVAADDHRVPDDRPLADLTAELTTLLGSRDARLRDEIAYGTLATWIDRGVYDDLLSGLGDGMVAGLAVGLGDRESDTVFRRSFSVLVLAGCLDRAQWLGLPAATVHRWGDAALSWWLRERDQRGYVPGAGWAHAIAHGADAVGVLAKSTHLAAPELTALLDVIADRIETLDRVLVHGEPDRMALAALAIVRRDLVPLSVLEPWVARIRGLAAGQAGTPDEAQGGVQDRVQDGAQDGAHDGDPYVKSGNAEAFLRAMHVQLIVTDQPPAVRSDLQLVLVEALRVSNSRYAEATGE